VTRRCLWGTVGAVVLLVLSGCRSASVSTTRTVPLAAKPVTKDATREELLESYNSMAGNIRSINSTVELKPTAGSKYSGLIEEYHEVKAFLFAERPAEIRVIGQAPVIGTTIFDMASDGQTFRVSIPSKGKFLTGPVSLERPSEKPIENLRPQHLLEALLWPEIRKEEATLFEEFNDETSRYYVLTVLRGGYRTEILRKVWFDRSDLRETRLQRFGPNGALVSDVRLSDWRPVDAPAAANGPSDQPAPPATFPRTIRIDRPHDDYRLDLQLLKVTLNEKIPVQRFELEQPAGSELVQVSEAAEKKQP